MTDSTVLPASFESPVRPRLNTGAGFWPNSIAVARRTIRKFARTPQLIVFTTIQSAVFLLMFRYSLGGAINTGGQVSYVYFLVPGFVTTAILFSGMGAAVGVAEDRAHGFIDRLRSLPIPRAAVLAGARPSRHRPGGMGHRGRQHLRLHRRVPAEGVRPRRLGRARALRPVRVRLRMDFHHNRAGRRERPGGAGLTLLVYPLVFISSAYVPVESMPAGVEAFGQVQPITPMVNAVRSLTGGAEADALLSHSTGYYVGVSLLWTAGIFVVFGLLAVWRFSRS
jgi:ABC-2 type transport system permease protein